MEHVMTGDRFSNLPWEVLDNILSRLPIKSAVQTSILSSKWRDKWINLSKLAFDDFSIDPLLSDPYKLARIINYVLLSHRGTIESFTFTTQSRFHSVDMDAWISFLRRCGVKELTCDLSKNYTLPSCLFSFASLKHLSLTNCWSAIPHTFTAFNGLVSLELKKFADGDFTDLVQSLIDNCPILEKLVLSDVCFEHLNVRVPNLKYLYLEGKFKSIYLENNPHLTDASFKMNSETVAEHAMVSDKSEFPSWLSGIRRLTLSGYFIRSLAARCVWRGISIACDKVEFIEIDELQFDQLEEISLARSIVMCSSNLKELHIKGSGANHDHDHQFAEGGLAHLSCCFHQLGAIKIEISRYDVEDDIRGSSFLEMMKLLLSCSPVLAKMHVHYNHSEPSDVWFMRELLLCERASSRLKLAYTSTHIPYQTPHKFIFLTIMVLPWTKLLDMPTTNALNVNSSYVKLDWC